MATTTNYGWDTPDDTDLVKDGAAAIRTLGSSVDTTTKALNPETTLGDIAYRSATSNTNTRLAIGSAGQVLTVAAGVPSWASPSDQTPLTTKGDVFTFSTVDARLGVGANGTVLTADSAEATGLKWATPGGGGYTLLNSGGTALSGGTVNITSISGSYIDLYLVLQDWQAGSSFNVRLNNSSTSDYYQAGTTVNGSGTAGFKGNAESTGLDMGITPSSGNQLNTSIIWLRNYADSNCSKVGTIQHFAKASTNREMSFVGIGYYNTTAITEINLIVNSAATFTGGTYYLYGVK